MINLNTILTTMAFYNLENYMEGVQINFASTIQNDRETFVSDFLISFTYNDMYCCYCIVNNPQSDTRIINVISVHGHFLYQGNDLSAAIGKVAEYYKQIEKSVMLENEKEIKEELEKEVFIEVQKKLKESGVITEESEPENKTKDEYKIDLTKN